MSCKFFSLSTYDYIRNTCLHQIDERKLVTYLSVLQLLHDESHPSHSSITDPLPTSLLLLVLAMLLCLGLSLSTKGIGPLCYYCCYCSYSAAAATAVPCYFAVTCCKIFFDTIVGEEQLLAHVQPTGAIDTTVRNSLPSTDLFLTPLLSYHFATDTLLGDTNLSGVVETDKLSC